LVLLCLSFSATAESGRADSVEAPDARVWLEGIRGALHPGSTMAARATLWTRDAEGVEETVVFDWLRRTRGRERSLVLEVREPEAMQGTVYQLVFPDDRTILRGVWSPERGRMNRMRGDRPTDPFLGSSLTYEDLGWVVLAAGATLAEAPDPERRDGGEPRVTIRSGPYGIYLGLDVEIDPGTGLPRRAVFRDRAEFPFRQLRYSDVRTVDGYRIPMRIEVEDVLSGTRSRLELEGVRFDGPADPRLFEPDFGGRKPRRGTRIDVPVEGEDPEGK
jgi:hypothetical protein